MKFPIDHNRLVTEMVPTIALGSDGNKMDTYTMAFSAEVVVIELN
jgi:hypothetical protein